MARKCSATDLSSVMMEFGVLRAVFFDMADRIFHAIDRFHRDDRIEIFGAPILFGRGFGIGEDRAHAFIGADFATGLVQDLPEWAGHAICRIALSISKVSAAPQMLVRRILALSAMARAFARSAFSFT